MLHVLLDCIHPNTHTKIIFRVKGNLNDSILLKLIRVSVDDSTQYDAIPDLLDGSPLAKSFPDNSPLLIYTPKCGEALREKSVTITTRWASQGSNRDLFVWALLLETPRYRVSPTIVECELKNFVPRLKISSRRIHVANDVTNVAHDRGKHKDSQEKHTASENIFLQVIRVRTQQLRQTETCKSGEVLH